MRFPLDPRQIAEFRETLSEFQCCFGHGISSKVVTCSGIDAVRQSLLSCEHKKGLDKFTRLLEGDRMAAPGENPYGGIGYRTPDSIRVFRRGDQIVFPPDDQ